ncbi:hypothetical protein LguiB_028289 [Lonicera macranthoides]
MDFSFIFLPNFSPDGMQDGHLHSALVMLEMHLCKMQAELENLVWDKKELEEQLSMAIKERKVMEVMLTELEEEHDQAIVKIELLEGELQDLKDQNHRLEEVQHEAFSSSTRQVDTDQKTSSTNKSATLHQIPSASIHKDTWEDQTKYKFRTQNLIRTGSEPSGPFESLTPGTANTDLNEVVYQRRKVALSQSLFSAILSLVVGIVVLEAKDPCMPLVVALFSVVAMSLKSVVQFFFTIKNKPASDAVALLSFNWFILGTLAYPTLPRVACIFTPYSLSFSMWIVRRLGFYS